MERTQIGENTDGERKGRKKWWEKNEGNKLKDENKLKGNIEGKIEGKNEGKN